MMSPDPPRVDRQNQAGSRDDESSATTAAGETPLPDDHFFVVQGPWDDDDADMNEFMFVHQDGPHEMDNGDTESDYSTDAEDDDNGAHATNNSEEPPGAAGGQVRGHYQLLIPFPPSQIVGDSDNEQVYGHSTETSENAMIEDHSSALHERIDQLSLDEDREPEMILSSSGEQAESYSKREISLTDDKVETIKSVMKNFALPPACIPAWANEVDEELWKKKLVDSIDTKSKQSSD